MREEIYEVTRDRFHLLDPSLYMLQGSWPKGSEVRALLDQTPVEVSMELCEVINALDRFRDLDALTSEEVTVTVALPEDLGDYRKLEIFAENSGRSRKWFSISVKELQRKQGRPYYYMEQEQVEGHLVRVRGWVVFSGPVRIRIFDEKGKKVETAIQRTGRPDVEQMFPEAEITDKPGFYAEVPSASGRALYLVFDSGSARTVHTIPLKKPVILKKKADKYLQKGFRYLKANGPVRLAEKVVGKVRTVQSRPVPYDKWILHHLPDQKELENQRREAFALRPKISVVVPLYKTPEAYLRRLIESLQEQTYGNWELCLSDGSGENSPLTEILKSFAEKDSRIRVAYPGIPLQISENTNSGLALATGDFIAFADHDDELTPNALYECVKAINRDPEVLMLYSDEDKMTMDGHKFFQPHFKPDLNPDLLRTVNYICHLLVVKREALDRVGTFRKEFDGAQDYDFILRCVEVIPERQIVHIPKILYHWRCHEDSTAENPESKGYAFDAGARAVQAHYDRTGMQAEVRKGEFPGLYRTTYHRAYDPLISILIPNKDHIDDLKRCLESIDENSTYRNYEYIIIENNSTEESTFRYYEELERSNPKARVVYWKGAFNFSAINNFGEQYAEGEYLLLLNNDTRIINPDCLEEMLGYCMRSDVGAVGARLYYEDDTIQHAGVVIGFGGIAGHCFVLHPRGVTGYCHRIICAQNYSAVTAACMMVKRSAFREVGGLSEELKVAFNDIDFCLKLRKAGYLIVYNPYAELYHYESKSRGLEDTPEKIERFNGEIEIFRKRWPEILREGDPYYNPNLTLNSQDFSLKRL